MIALTGGQELIAAIVALVAVVVLVVLPTCRRERAPDDRREERPWWDRRI